MDNIKIKYNGNTYEYPRGTTLLEISSDFKSDFKYEIIIGKIDGNTYELNHEVTGNCNISFYDLTNHFGNKVYERGLIFLFISAMRDLFNTDVKVEHSIDKGIACEILDKKVKKEDILLIKNKINEYVSSKTPFIKGIFPRTSVIDYYKRIKQYDKSESLEYVIRTSVLSYRFNNNYDYFFGEMPIDSSYIKYFDIEYIDESNLVLLLPNIYSNGEIEPYNHHEGIYNAYRDFADWASSQGVEYLSDLNKTVSASKINDLIYMNESYQNKKLYDVAVDIKERGKIKIVLIAGPSSSGKTTTSKKLAFFLKSLGMNPESLSVDDYFKERKDTPKDENGEPDFESLNAIDLDIFNDDLYKLLEGNEVVTPTFNFKTGKKEFNKTMKLEKNGILIIEGLHALNDELTKSINDNKKYKIYISPLASLNIDKHNRISTSDLRLLRRMVRDNTTRGYDASETLSRWRKVRKGEEMYIFPFQSNNDVVINSSLLYELSVIRTYVEPLLFSVDRNDPNYNEAIRLINLIRNVLPIAGVKIPYDSILREFIGDSYFK